jgi:hydrogenase 3 maturation protease
MDKNFENQLAGFIDGHVCLVGIGNRYLHDDGVGSLIAQALEPGAEFDVIDAGFMPENCLETVADTHPDTILMIDATDFGGVPGQVSLLYPDKMAYSWEHNQAGSLRMLVEYMQARTKARVALVAIQPADLSAGESLSPDVSDTLNELLETLPAICSRHVH